MMKKKLLIPLTALLCGCSNSNSSTQFDPFMIGDNLEVISSVEASLIANEAYDNLKLVSTLSKSSTVSEDSTKFYTGSFASFAVNKKTTTKSQASYYANKIESNRDVTTITYLGNDSTEENRNTALTEWYGIKPVEEGEEPSKNYALLRRTIDRYNGISSTRYSSSDDFSIPDNVNAVWNRHIVESINEDYLTSDILYSSNYTYVRDNLHIVGYFMETTVTTETSKIAPGKEDVSYVKKVESLSVVDFYKDDVLEIGWTVRTVSNRTITSYLNSIDGSESDPIEISRQEDITSLSYERSHSQSEDIPTYELSSFIPFAISKFAINEEQSDIEYVTKYELENNDNYYQHFEDEFTGHAYYKEQKLEVGFYSFFDGEPEEEKDYEKWGYNDIIANKCVNYIVDPKTLPDEDIQEIIKDHDKLFYVASEATFAFRIVFDATMTTASEFSVAIVGR